MDGWISIHRKIKDHWIWQEKPFDKRSAWLDLLMMVNHEDKKVLLGNELIEVKRGSRVTSIRKLCDRWGWSNTKVKNFLEILEKDEMLVVKSDTKKTTISIVNYSDYQDSDDSKNDKEASDERQASDSKTSREHTNNNDNNDNNDNKSIYSPDKNPNTPYKEIVEMFNGTCVSFPKIERITDKRKKTMRTRWKKYNDMEMYKKLFQMAESSEFLSGRNGKWTNCNFDWLINENNMVKVLEGNYNRGGKNESRQIPRRDEEKTIVDRIREEREGKD